MVVEVLVHISTSATRQTDDLYRSLADAYLDFDPRTRHALDSSKPNADGDASATSTSRTDGALREASQGQVAVDPSILSPSKDSYGSFPSHLSSGGHDTTHDSRLDDGSIPTSSRLARLDRIHAHWKQQVTPRSSFIQGQHRSRPASRASEQAETAFIEDTQLAAQALQSQLQDSYYTTDEDASEGEDEPIGALDEELLGLDGPRRTNSAKPGAANFVSTTFISTKATPPVYSGRRRAERNTMQQPGQAELDAVPAAPTLDTLNAVKPAQLQEPSESTAQNSSRKRKVIDDNTRSDTQDFNTLPFDAFPPAPKISVECPGRLPSQITKYLGAIKAKNPKRFRHSKKHRTPKADERGHWSVACSSWPVNLQQEFWTTLRDQVSSGRLGWGTTLHREASSNTTLGRIRLYCWAEVAEHAWLVLWLSSKGQVAGSESRWVDAEGAVVFEVA